MKIWDFCEHCENFNCPDCAKCLRKTFRNIVIKDEPQRYSQENKREELYKYLKEQDCKIVKDSK